MSLPSFVKIYEVGPRDGLQNESKLIPAGIKIELINKLSNAGIKFIEATSFVSPKWVPQLADSSDVLHGIKHHEGVIYSALVPNERGMEGALESHVKEIAIFTAASEAFTKKNINCSIAESLDRFIPVIDQANKNNIKVRGYVSTIVECPYSGKVKPQLVSEVAKELYDMGCYEVSLGDTTGVGTPIHIKKVLESVLKNIPVEKIALHCHDTYGQGLVNIYAALEMGISVFDSSVGGLGGCPYAEGASGNVATEDVLYMLAGMGIETDINMYAVCDAAQYICGFLGMEPRSRVSKALPNHKILE
jgi:hydroxymethylglutaryl-CoA lyase